MENTVQTECQASCALYRQIIHKTLIECTCSGSALRGLMYISHKRICENRSSLHVQFYDSRTHNSLTHGYARGIHIQHKRD